MRINGQAVPAHDLLLAGRAAHRIEETALHDSIINRQVLAKMIADYPVALSEMFGQGGKAENVAAARAQIEIVGGGAGSSGVGDGCSGTPPKRRTWRWKPTLAGRA